MSTRTERQKFRRWINTTARMLQNVGFKVEATHVPTEGEATLTGHIVPARYDGPPRRVEYRWSQFTFQDGTTTLMPEVVRWLADDGTPIRTWKPSSHSSFGRILLEIAGADRSPSTV